MNECIFDFQPEVFRSRDMKGYNGEVSEQNKGFPSDCRDSNQLMGTGSFLPETFIKGIIKL